MDRKQRNSILALFGQMLLVASIFLMTGRFVYSWYKYYSFVPATFPHYWLSSSTPTLRVFFLGNSYTFFNDLPDMVSVVAASDREHPVNIEADSFTRGGKTLKELFEIPSAQEALRSQSWDYVILQDMSVLPSDPIWTQDMHQGIRDWNMLVKSMGFRDTLYETWARKPGTDWYDNDKHPDLDLVDPDVMQEKIDKAYKTFSSEIGATLVPVGDYWAKCRNQDGVPDLYYFDGTHPSVAGTYLTALLFYQSITGHGLSGITFVPFGMSSKEAEAIKHCVSGVP